MSVTPETERRQTAPVRLVALWETARKPVRPLTSPLLVLGRSKQCDVVLESASVAPQHAAIVLVDGSCYVCDLGTPEGTFVNDQPVRGCRLSSGDEMSLGRYRFRIETDEDLSATASSGRLHLAEVSPNEENRQSPANGWLEKDRPLVVLGPGGGADVLIPGATDNPWLCLLARTEYGVVLREFGGEPASGKSASSPVRLNGQPVNRAAHVAPGDELTVGPHTWRVGIESGGGSSSLSPLMLDRGVTRDTTAATDRLRGIVTEMGEDDAELCSSLVPPDELRLDAELARDVRDLETAHAQVAAASSALDVTQRQRGELGLTDELLDELSAAGGGERSVPSASGEKAVSKDVLASFEALRSALDTERAALSAERVRLQAQRTKLETEQQEVTLLRRQADALREETERRQEAITHSQQRLHSDRRALEEQRAALDGLKEQVEHEREEIAKGRERLGLDQAEIATERAALAEEARRLTALKQELDEAAETLADRARMDVEREELEGARRELTILQQHLEQRGRKLDEREESLRTRFAELEQRFAEEQERLKGRASELRAELLQLRESQDHRQAELDAQAARLEETRERNKREAEAAHAEWSRALDEREASLKEQAATLEKRQEAFDARRSEMSEQEKRLTETERALSQRERSLSAYETVLHERDARVRERQTNLDSREADLTEREKQFDSARRKLEQERQSITTARETVERERAELAELRNTLEAERDRLAAVEETLSRQPPLRTTEAPDQTEDEQPVEAELSRQIDEAMLRLVEEAGTNPIVLGDDAPTEDQEAPIVSRQDGRSRHPFSRRLVGTAMLIGCVVAIGTWALSPRVLTAGRLQIDPTVWTTINLTMDDLLGEAFVSRVSQSLGMDLLGAQRDGRVRFAADPSGSLRIEGKERDFVDAIGTAFETELAQQVAANPTMSGGDNKADTPAALEDELREKQAELEALAASIRGDTTLNEIAAAEQRKRDLRQAFDQSESLRAKHESELASLQGEDLPAPALSPTRVEEELRNDDEYVQATQQRLARARGYRDELVRVLAAGSERAERLDEAIRALQAVAAEQRAAIDVSVNIQPLTEIERTLTGLAESLAALLKVWTEAQAEASRWTERDDPAALTTLRQHSEEMLGRFDEDSRKRLAALGRIIEGIWTGTDEVEEHRSLARALERPRLRCQMLHEALLGIAAEILTTENYKLDALGRQVVDLGRRQSQRRSQIERYIAQRMVDEQRAERSRRIGELQARLKESTSHRDVALSTLLSADEEISELRRRQDSLMQRRETLQASHVEVADLKARLQTLRETGAEDPGDRTTERPIHYEPVAASMEAAARISAASGWARSVGFGLTAAVGFLVIGALLERVHSRSRPRESARE
jgi:hypothetical protein